jgi:hypothetical protein
MGRCVSLNSDLVAYSAGNNYELARDPTPTIESIIDAKCPQNCACCDNEVCEFEPEENYITM